MKAECLGLVTGVNLYTWPVIVVDDADEVARGGQPLERTQQWQHQRLYKSRQSQQQSARDCSQYRDNSIEVSSTAAKTEAMS